MFATGLRWKSL